MFVVHNSIYFAFTPTLNGVFCVLQLLCSNSELERAFREKSFICFNGADQKAAPGCCLARTCGLFNPQNTCSTAVIPPFSAVHGRSFLRNTQLPASTKLTHYRRVVLEIVVLFSPAFVL